MFHLHNYHKSLQGCCAPQWRGRWERLLGKGNVWKGDSMLQAADLAGAVLVKNNIVALKTMLRKLHVLIVPGKWKVYSESLHELVDHKKRIGYCLRSQRMLNCKFISTQYVMSKKLDLSILHFKLLSLK